MGLLKFTILSCLAFSLTAAAAEVPRKSPELAIHMADGKDLLLSQMRGKVVVLAFILTTCPHCQQFTQKLNAIQKEYGPQGVQVVAAAFNDDAQTMLPGFLAKFQPAFPLGWEERASAVGFMGLSIINSGYVPKAYFIDKAGVIQRQFDGMDPNSPFFVDSDKVTRATLDEMLRAPVAQRKTAAKTVRKP